MIHSVPTMVARRLDRKRKARKTEAPAEEREARPVEEEAPTGVGWGALLREVVADALESTALWLRRSSERRVPGSQRSASDGDRVDFERMAREDDSGRGRSDSARKADGRRSRER